MSSKWTIQNWTTGELNALVKNLGGERVARKIQKGKVSLEGAVKTLFDKHGRRIPEDLQANVHAADRNFRLNQPKLDEEVEFVNRITRLHRCLITAGQFMAETKRLLAIIRDNSQIANIANGVFLPVVLPKLVTDDLGAELEMYLADVNKSYRKTFSDRIFNNYRKGELVSKVSVVDGSRHDQLISRMKEGPVIGLHFPNPLQGFSINADREQMSTLPEGFILSGLDTPIAMAMYPDILARDWNTPGLDMAALQWQSATPSPYFKARDLQWQSADYSLHFEANDGRLDFDGVDDRAYAYDYYSGGLLFFG